MKKFDIVSMVDFLFSNQCNKFSNTSIPIFFLNIRSYGLSNSIIIISICFLRICVHHKLEANHSENISEI